MHLAEQVATNLTHYTLWHGVEIVQGDKNTFLCGFPPSKLTFTDAPDKKEWVVPTDLRNKNVTMDKIEEWFHEISMLESRPDRVTLAIVNDDGTVVYYFVHDGVVKPRQN